MILRVKEREQARALRSKGKSIRDIAKILGVSKGSVSIWVRDIELTYKQQQILAEAEKRGAALGREKIGERWKKYSLKNPKEAKSPRWPTRPAENFFLEWTPNIAYVLGYFAADGSMYKNKNGSAYISFYSADLELVTSVKRILAVENNIEVYAKPVPHKTAYVLQIGSKKMYESLLCIGLTPKKSLSLRMPQVPDNVFSHFLRGYFDGDGSAYFGSYFSKSKNKIITSGSIRLTSGSKDFLESLKEKIKTELKITSGSLYSKKGGFDLAYSGIVVLELYRFMYSSVELPHLRRKRLILERYIEYLRP